MDRITFSYNWNNKLDCNCFTTLRKHVPSRFQSGKLFEVWFHGKPRCQVEVLDVKIITVDSLNSWIAYLDTGYSLKETYIILERMYSAYFAADMRLDFVLFRQLESGK